MLDRVHPERRVAGFTKHDADLTFLNFVRGAALELRAERILDFGAGRGAFQSDPSAYRRDLHDLRSTGAEVWAGDVDPVVLGHPASHHQHVFDGPRLPYPDGFFDMIVSVYVFEHLDDPAGTAAELLRVLRPGGMICARTPNRWGYVAVAGRVVPNRLHSKVLQRVQPHRRPEDVFPTRYKMNTVRAVRSHFPGCVLSYYRDSGDPAYHCGSPGLYRWMRLLHRLLPDMLQTSLCVFVSKPA